MDGLGRVKASGDPLQWISTASPDMHYATGTLVDTNTGKFKSINYRELAR